MVKLEHGRFGKFVEINRKIQTTMISGLPYNNRVERIARGQHGLCSVGLYGVGLTANPALVPYGLVPPGQRPPAVLTAHSSVIRTE